MSSYADFFRRSIDDRDGFWGEQSQLIDWHKPFDQVCDYLNPPFARWFCWRSNKSCHNAVDRHLATRGDQNALIFVSRNQYRKSLQFQRVCMLGSATHGGYSQRPGCEGRSRPDLHAHDCRSLLCHVGLRAHWCHSLWWCSVVLPVTPWQARIEDATPTLIIEVADAGMRGGRLSPKHLLDEAIQPVLTNLPMC